MGIDHIEVNTNGVRFGQDIEFLKQCKEAGVDSLYFSFDGLTSDVYMTTCGKDLLQSKLKAIENCAKVGMGVTLVCVVSPNINLDQIGDVIQFAKSKVPTVKGIHFQPHQLLRPVSDQPQGHGPHHHSGPAEGHREADQGRAEGGQLHSHLLLQRALRRQVHVRAHGGRLPVPPDPTGPGSAQGDQGHRHQDQEGDIGPVALHR